MSSVQMRDSGTHNESNHAALVQPPADIEFIGNKNRLRLDPSANLSSFRIKIKGDKNLIVIDRGCEIRGLVYIKGNCSSLRIGPRATAAGARFSIGDGGSVVLGKDCMLSRDIEIRCWDEHPIYDLGTRARINGAQDVIIGEHVWIGQGVTINKGVTVAAGIVIGASSLVTRTLSQPNSIYAGSPAKLIRENIAWARSPSAMNWDTADLRNM
ncbi:acetyltransferase-like isoleucine patch superfamily enzyme [Rhizobium halophytocola]|uniref:Acetyltransferase-like isoleucine patch superfamily enzyme n=1 Tax=Rhizobium halophytocola TaxID=735519 RepID=A0ABS4E2D5_9HYPH|nr:acetyltransferase-like isoleucine patch superfamily enzyme [Rhizobium halophytocola]